MSNERKIALQQIVKGSGFVFLGQIISFVVGFFFHLILARHLGPDGYGVISLGIVVMSIGLIFAQMGLSSGLKRFISFYSAKGDEGSVRGVIFSGLKIFLLSSVIVTLLGLALSDILASYVFHSSELKPIVILFVLAIPLASLVNILTQAFLGFKKPFHSMIFDSFLHKFLRLFLTGLGVWAGYEVLGISYVYVFGLLLSGLIGIVMLFRFVPKSDFSVSKTRELLAFSTPLLVGGSLGLIMGRIDSLMIGYFIDPENVGLYRVAYSFAAFLGVFQLSFGSFFLPVITGYFAKKNFSMLRQIYNSVARLILLIGLPCALVFIFIPKPLISIIFGNSYSAASTVLWIISCGSLISMFFGPGNATLQAVGNTKLCMRIRFTVLFLNLFLNLILIPIIGIVGAAIATAMNIMLGSILSFWKVRSFYRISLNLLAYLKYSVVGLFSVLSLKVFFYLIPVRNIFVLVLGCLFFFALYGLLFFIFRLFDSDDLLLIRGFESKLGLHFHPVSRFIKVK